MSFINGLTSAPTDTHPPPDRFNLYPKKELQLSTGLRPNAANCLKWHLYLLQSARIYVYSHSLGSKQWKKFTIIKNSQIPISSINPLRSIQSQSPFFITLFYVISCQNHIKVRSCVFSVDCLIDLHTNLWLFCL